MNLLTEAQREQLLAVGRDRDRGQRPDAKLLDPCGTATRLVSELDHEDGEATFSLAQN